MNAIFFLMKRKMKENTYTMILVWCIVLWLTRREDENNNNNSYQKRTVNRILCAPRNGDDGIVVLCAAVTILYHFARRILLSLPSGFSSRSIAQESHHLYLKPICCHSVHSRSVFSGSGYMMRWRCWRPREKRVYDFAFHTKNALYPNNNNNSEMQARESKMGVRTKTTPAHSKAFR